MHFVCCNRAEIKLFAQVSSQRFEKIIQARTPMGCEIECELSSQCNLLFRPEQLDVGYC